MTQESNSNLKVSVIIVGSIIGVILLVLLIWYLYVKFKKNNNNNNNINNNGPVNCAKLNSNYQNINYTQWTDNDRNTAIWLINNQDTSLDVPMLQSLNNDLLQQLLMGICGPMQMKINCSTINSNYKNVDYTKWTDNDRNTAITIINNKHPSLQIDYLQKMKNIILYNLLILYCQ